MVNDLEQEVNNDESKSFMGKAGELAFNLTLAGATTALGVVIVGSLAPIVATAVGAGVFLGKMWRDEENIYDIINDSLRAYSVINTILYPVLSFGDMTYHLIQNYDLVGKAARTLWGMVAHQAVFQVSYGATTHMFKNYFNPEGVVNSVTNNYFKNHLRFGVGFAPGWALAANGITELTLGGLTLPTFAWNALPLLTYDSYNPIQSVENKSDNISQLPQGMLQKRAA